MPPEESSKGKKKPARRPEPRKRIQTAEGWKRSMLKIRESQQKTTRKKVKS